MRRVLLIGATGTFGSRLAALLATFTDIELVLAARGLTALSQLRESLTRQYPTAHISIRQFDRSRLDNMAELAPWLVIDTAGPFQGSDYGLALAATRCTLKPLARPLRFIADLLEALGSDRGGMLVQASGVNGDGQNVIARWSLLAKENAGPNVPIAAAAAIVRGMLENRITQTGAQACVGLLNTAAILGELRHLPITTREDETWPDHPVLFRRLLGRHVDNLPQAVRSVHDQTHAENFSGTAVARCGHGFPARLLRWLVGLPKNGCYPVTVQISPDKTGETWTRQFGQERFSSHLRSTSHIGSFEEQFGPLRFTFDMTRTNRGVRWQFLRWSFFTLPLPTWAAPKIRAVAEETNSDYRFCVAVLHPWLGLLFAYRGTLLIDQERPAALQRYEEIRG